ncbi:MAG: hypothetical protein WAQ98_19290 [Blastocatellia bacterium]
MKEDRIKQIGGKKFNSKGFGFLEIVIAVVLSSAVVAVLVTMTLGGLRGGRIALGINDMSLLTSQKCSQLFKDVSKELKAMGNNTDRLGSIDVAQPVNGYFDLLNESGCVLKTNIYSLENESLGVDKGNNGNTLGLGGGTTKGSGGSGGITKGGSNDGNGNDDDKGGGNGAIGGVDCSLATDGKPTDSLVARYRRQWVLVKDKPNIGDVTVAVILIDLGNNSIIRSEIITKVDGEYAK